MKFIITHPSRGLYVGDKVMHCGAGRTSRGDIGTVHSISESNVFVQWEGYSNCSRQGLSISWSLENLVVSLQSLLTNRCRAFNAQAYIDKYSKFIITPELVNRKKTLRMLPHESMKFVVDAETPPKPEPIQDDGVCYEQYTLHSEVGVIGAASTIEGAKAKSECLIMSGKYNKITIKFKKVVTTERVVNTIEASSGFRYTS